MSYQALKIFVQYLHFYYKYKLHHRLCCDQKDHIFSAVSSSALARTCAAAGVCTLA